MKTRILFSLWVLFLFSCLFVHVRAATINAASCSLTDVQTAITPISSGGTVLVPEGNCTWANTLIITKGITLQGAGMGKTTIMGKVKLINYEPDATATATHETLIITGFTFDGNGATSEQLGWSGLVNLYDSTSEYVNVIITNNRFRNTLGTGVIIDGTVYGVVASNQFYDIFAPIRSMGNNQYSWSAFSGSLAYGGSDNIFFEDNYISFSSSYHGDPGWIETGQGGRIVVRYNTWNDANTTGGEYWDVHGLQTPNSSGYDCQQYSTMVAEYYGNLRINTQGAYRCMFHRGSWLMQFNNVITGSGSPPNTFGEYSCDDCAAFGVYPQHISNTYFWNNLDDGEIKDLQKQFDNCATYTITENRDYFNYNSLCTSSSCSAGIGCGATAPTGTCTPGVGYWVTDYFPCYSAPGAMAEMKAVTQAGRFYKCTAPNTWTLYYQPYTYPHPLRMEPASNVCGNGIVEPGEACDLTDLAGYSCKAFGFAGGTISCKSDCSGLDTTQCTSGSIKQASSCSHADVQSAISSASEGDTVLVPNGTCRYNTYLNINKGITLMGAGIDKTVIQCNTTDGAFVISPSVNNTRITGFTFDGESNPVDWNVAIRVGRWNRDNGCHNFRIDHNKFMDFRSPGEDVLGFYVIRTYGYNYGVIDHNTFYDCRGEIIYIAGEGNQAYERDQSLGMYETGTVFVEDNDFVLSGIESGHVGDNAVDMNEGARVVFRHNSLEDTDYNWWDSPFDTHGFCVCDGQCTYPTDDIRSTLSYEIYDNNFKTDVDLSLPGTWNRALNLRGGKGAIFNNNFSGEWSTLIRFTNERSYNYGCSKPALIGSPNLKYENQCHVDTDSGGELINEGLADGSLVFGQCLDQINNVYIWNNSFNGNAIDVLKVYVDDSGQTNDYRAEDIVKDRNYFFSEMTDYKPYPYPHPLTSIDEPPQTTCQSEGHQCCASCASGPHPEYDSSCSAQVCCSSCSGSYFLPEQYIEAESGELTSPMQTGTNSTASGGRYIYTPTSSQGSINFTFHITSAGKYKIEARVLTPLTEMGSCDSFFLGLDGQPASGNNYYTYDLTQKQSFIWDNVSLRGAGTSAPQFDPVIWDLTAGLHNFTFYGREYNAWIDRIILKKAYHRSDSSQNGCIDMNEVIAFLDRWKISVADVTMPEMMESIGLWKAGLGCI
jgi:hypothetical protein